MEELRVRARRKVAQPGREWLKCVATLPFCEDKGNGFRASGKDAPLLSLQRRERRVKVRGDREKTSVFFGLHGLFLLCNGRSRLHS